MNHLPVEKLHFWNKTHWKNQSQLQSVATGRKSAHIARFTATATRRDWTCSSQLQWVSDRRRQSQRVARVSHTKRFSATGQLQTIASRRVAWCELGFQSRRVAVAVNRAMWALLRLTATGSDFSNVFCSKISFCSIPNGSSWLRNVCLCDVEATYLIITKLRAL